MQRQFLTVHKVVILFWAFSELLPVRSSASGHDWMSCQCHNTAISFSWCYPPIPGKVFPWQPLCHPWPLGIVWFLEGWCPKLSQHCWWALAILNWAHTLLHVLQVTPLFIQSTSVGFFSFFKRTDMVWGVKYYSCVFCISMGAFGELSGRCEKSKMVN